MSMNEIDKNEESLNGSLGFELAEKDMCSTNNFNCTMTDIINLAECNAFKDEEETCGHNGGDIIKDNLILDCNESSFELGESETVSPDVSCIKLHQLMVNSEASTDTVESNFSSFEVIENKEAINDLKSINADSNGFNNDPDVECAIDNEEVATELNEIQPPSDCLKSASSIGEVIPSVLVVDHEEVVAPEDDVILPCAKSDSTENIAQSSDCLKFDASAADEISSPPAIASEYEEMTSFKNGSIKDIVDSSDLPQPDPNDSPTITDNVVPEYDELGLNNPSKILVDHKEVVIATEYDEKQQSPKDCSIKGIEVLPLDGQNASAYGTRVTVQGGNVDLKNDEEVIRLPEIGLEMGGKFDQTLYDRVLAIFPKIDKTYLLSLCVGSHFTEALLIEVVDMLLATGHSKSFAPKEIIFGDDHLEDAELNVGVLKDIAEGGVTSSGELEASMEVDSDSAMPRVRASACCNGLIDPHETIECNAGCISCKACIRNSHRCRKGNMNRQCLGGCGGVYSVNKFLDAANSAQDSSTKSGIIVYSNAAGSSTAEQDGPNAIDDWNRLCKKQTLLQRSGIEDVHIPDREWVRSVKDVRVANVEPGMASVNTALPVNVLEANEQKKDVHVPNPSLIFRRTAFESYNSDLYNRLLDMFPTIDETHLLRLIRNKTCSEETLEDIIEELLLADYPKSNVAIKQNVALLSNIFPDIDEDFLQAVADDLLTDEQLNAFIDDNIDINLTEDDVQAQVQENLGTALECACCYEQGLEIQDLMDCSGSGCLCCKRCVARYCEISFAEASVDTMCLLGCGGHYSLRQFQDVLSEQLFEGIASMLQMREIKAASIDGLEYCPFCQYAAITTPEDVVFNCLQCGKNSCRLCQRDAHPSFLCSEVEQDEDVRKRTFVENKMSEAFFRVCPSCGLKLIKDYGCNKVMCRCGVAICYVCKARVIDYKHFNGNGGTNYHLCPLFNDTNVMQAEEVRRSGIRAKEEVGNNLKIDPTIDHMLPRS